MSHRLNLMLHCGASKVDREQVVASETPQGTDTWFPIPHKSLIGLVERKLPDYGLQVVQEQHALMRDEHRYFGLYQVQPTDQSLISPDYSLVLGVRNSHDKSFPAGLCLGSGVFVCDNLAFSAEVVIGRRHTRHIMDDLPRLIAAALGKLATSRLDQQTRIDAYKGTEITDSQAALLLLEAFEAKAVKKTQIANVWEQWRDPAHPEFRQDGKTVWRLMNGVTEVQKGINPFELQNRTQRLHPLLDVACGIQIGQTDAPQMEGDVVDAEFTVNNVPALPAPQQD